MPSIHLSGRSGDHQRRPRCRAMPLGSLRTNNLKKCQHSNDNDSSIYALLLGPNTAQHPPKFLLSSRIHPVHAELTRRGQRIEGQCQGSDAVCIIRGMREVASLWRGQDRIKLFRTSSFTHLALRVDGCGQSKARTVRFAAYNPNSVLVHPFSPPYHQVLTENYCRGDRHWDFSHCGLGCSHSRTVHAYVSDERTICDPDA
jgi:hypothetical protein